MVVLAVNRNVPSVCQGLISPERMICRRRRRRPSLNISLQLHFSLSLQDCVLHQRCLLQSCASRHIPDPTTMNDPRGQPAARNKTLMFRTTSLEKDSWSKFIVHPGRLSPYHFHGADDMESSSERKHPSNSDTQHRLSFGGMPHHRHCLHDYCRCTLSGPT